MITSEHVPREPTQLYLAQWREDGKNQEMEMRTTTHFMSFPAKRVVVVRGRQIFNPIYPEGRGGKGGA